MRLAGRPSHGGQGSPVASSATTCGHLGAPECPSSRQHAAARPVPRVGLPSLVAADSRGSRYLVGFRSLPAHPPNTS